MFLYTYSSLDHFYYGHVGGDLCNQLSLTIFFVLCWQISWPHQIHFYPCR